ncbi:hypothetical protein [Bacillus sp. 1P06AnD]|uniref:hypothetical protein n=1 Tax=Bacillus sp. 1P06AnD TaxID=3132208 RepID=UPI0039A184CB
MAIDKNVYLRGIFEIDLDGFYYSFGELHIKGSDLRLTQLPFPSCSEAIQLPLTRIMAIKKPYRNIHLCFDHKRSSYIRSLWIQKGNLEEFYSFMNSMR